MRFRARPSFDGSEILLETVRHRCNLAVAATTGL